MGVHVSVRVCVCLLVGVLVGVHVCVHVWHKSKVASKDIKATHVLSSLEQKNLTVENIDQPQTEVEENMWQGEQRSASTETIDPPSSSFSSTTESADSTNQLRMFVTALTIEVLTKCNALENHDWGTWVAQTNRLIDQTMERLSTTKGSSLNIEKSSKVCKAVLKDLEKQFCSRQWLENAILLQDPIVEAAIVQSSTTHIKKMCAKKKTLLICVGALMVLIALVLLCLALTELYK